MSETRPVSAGLTSALVVYALWTTATWWFEGRILTLMRPDAVADRLVYAMAVNLLLGIVGVILLTGWLAARRRGPTPAERGLGNWARLLPASGAGLLLGLLTYILQGAPSSNPTVVTNAFAQVFVVSVAEVMVCWVLVGASLQAALRPRFGRGGTALAAVGAALLFGVYHFAHSPPFNTLPMVALLSVVGLATGAFFFISRDALGTALVTIAVLLGGYRWLRRPSPR